MSLNLYEALGYEGVLVSPELVHNVLPLTEDEGKVPEEILEIWGLLHMIIDAFVYFWSVPV